jgi:hypothetical protein
MDFCSISAVGSSNTVSEDNPIKFFDCLNVERLVKPKHLRASFHYHETGGVPATMLNNSDIDHIFAACGGVSPVITLTRAYWPGTDWRTSIEAILGNPHLLGVAMEFNPDDFGKRNEDDFVRELLSRGKWPIFLLPFRTWSSSTEEIMKQFFQWFASRGVSLNDDRIIFTLANYDSPPLPVVGQSNSIESALRASLAGCGKPIAKSIDLEALP